MSKRPLLALSLVAVVVAACSRPEPNKAEPDHVALDNWNGPLPATPEEAVAAQGDQYASYPCPFGLKTGTCGGYRFVTLSGGYVGTTYYFDDKGVVGVKTSSDVPTPPSDFGVIPKCTDLIVTKHVCKKADM